MCVPACNAIYYARTGFDLYASFNVVVVGRVTLAADGELGLALGREGPPFGLVNLSAVLSDRRFLCWLIEGLEVEHVQAPVESSADTLLEECLGVLGSSL